MTCSLYYAMGRQGQLEYALRKAEFDKPFTEMDNLKNAVRCANEDVALATEGFRVARARLGEANAAKNWGGCDRAYWKRQAMIEVNQERARLRKAEKALAAAQAALAAATQKYAESVQNDGDRVRIAA